MNVQNECLWGILGEKALGVSQSPIGAMAKQTNRQGWWWVWVGVGWGTVKILELMFKTLFQVLCSTGKNLENASKTVNGKTYFLMFFIVSFRRGSKFEIVSKNDYFFDWQNSLECKTSKTRKKSIFYSH